jgi:alpha-L-rhamnosidase
VETSDPDSVEVMKVSARTLRMSSHENYDDSPYFEQFSYAADARLQALGSLYLCNDPTLPRKTLRLFLDSLRADGLVDARVPCQYARQTIPYFCLHWILMVEDYWTWVGLADVAFVRECLVAVDSILVWFRARLRGDGFVGPAGGWNMVDHSAHWPNGEPAAVSAGGSTYLTSLFISALQAAQRLHRLAGMPEDAGRWENLATRLVPLVRAGAWDPAAGLFVEGVEHRAEPYSQHAQAAAINAGVATPEQIRCILEQLWAHPGLIRTNSMQSFYLTEALARAGRYEQVHDHVLLPWRQALRDGLTTWPEYPDPSRSDCHGWAAWPAVEYVRSVLGVRAAAPGWTGVRLAPETAGLEWASGQVPTPVGEIQVHWQRAEDAIELEANVPGGVPVEVCLGSLVQRYPAGGAIKLVARRPQGVLA